MQKFVTLSSLKTKRLGAKLAQKVTRLPLGRRAKLISLEGDLGSGKTTFVQGFLRVLGYKGRVTSPTFIFMRRFGIRRPPYSDVFHLDAYRVKTKRDFNNLGLDRFMRDPRNIFIVEWGRNIGHAFRGAKKVKFEHGKHEKERIIKL